MLVFHVDPGSSTSEEMELLKFATEQEVRERGLSQRIHLTIKGRAVLLEPRQKPLDLVTVMALVETARGRLAAEGVHLRGIRVYSRKETGMGPRHVLLKSQGWTEEAKTAEAEARRTGSCTICKTPLPHPSVVGNRWRPYHVRIPLALKIRGQPSCSDLYYERYFRGWGVCKRACLRASGGKCARCGKKVDPAVLKKALTSQDPVVKGFEFDHIVEIAIGGDPLDPSNVQLLCEEPCHLEKTRAFLSSSQRRVAVTAPRALPTPKSVQPTRAPVAPSRTLT